MPGGRRRRINRITTLQRDDGHVCSDHDEVKEEIQGFYKDLYSSQGYRDMSELLQFVTPQVTVVMNESLERDYTAEEVRTTLFQMAPSKAPGIDGFTAGFFQRH